MQANSEYIYEKVAKESGIDLEFISSVGDFIQREIANNLRNPETLILKVKGLGSWHLRRMRLQKSYENLLKVDPGTLKNDESRESLKLYLERMKARLDEYEIYLSKKQQKKANKNDYYSKKSSEDNS